MEPIIPGLETAEPEKYRHLYMRGRRWLCLGLGMMGSSFAINYLLFDSGTSFVSVMYVLTSIGIICLMKGLADVLGF